jgi:putative inorganic carbon (HCO3(-)) transporter
MILSLFFIILSPYTALLPLFYILYQIIRGRLLVRNNAWNIGIFLLFIWALIVAIINQSIFSFASAIVLLLYFALGVYIENRFDTIDKIDYALKHLVVFSILAAFYGFFEKLSFRYFHSIVWQHLLGIPSEVAAKHRVYSTFGNPNVTGAFMASMIMVCLYFIPKAEIKQKILYGFSILIFVFTLYLTGSRGAEIGLLFGLIANYQLRNHKRSVWAFVIVILFIVYIAFTPFHFFNIRNLMYRDLSNSFSDRYSIWVGCLKMFKQKPLAGWGLMGIYENSHFYLQNNKVVFHAHNLWISFGTTLGVIGLSIYLYLKFHMYKNIKVLYTNNCSLTPLLSSIQAIVIGQGLVDFTIMTPQSGILFIASAALIFTFSKQYIDGFMIQNT